MTFVERRLVGAGDTAVDHMLGPFRPRPVPLLVSARRVDQPTGGDPGESDSVGRFVDRVGWLSRSCGAGECTRRGRGPWRPPPASPRREHPQREQCEEDEEEHPGAMTVEVRECSLLVRAERTLVGHAAGL
jgi:hypothetical protein